MVQEHLQDILLGFNSLTVYRNLLKDGLVKDFLKLADLIVQASASVYDVADSYGNFACRLLSSGKSFRRYLAEALLYDENIFTRQAEHSGRQPVDDRILKAAARDLDILSEGAAASSSLFKQAIHDAYHQSGSRVTEFITLLPVWETVSRPESDSPAQEADCTGILRSLLGTSGGWGGCLDNLMLFHRQNGCGIFARYLAFRWENTAGTSILKGIKHPDPIRLSDLICYEEQRAQVVSNTRAFLKGYPANNLLLYGDRGTGKSSTVKALLNEFASSGLRMIEVPKKHLTAFPEVYKILRDRTQKFIIFIDDLAFEDNEENYTALKAALEGTIESKPDNVVLYATSNRRHIIREKFSDRAGLLSGSPEDEIRAGDNIQEKLSLSDRFGMTLVFASPGKDEFLKIVEGIASARGLAVSRDTLHKEALRWELWYNGRSPRSARQFVDWLESEERERGASSVYTSES